MEQKTEQKKKNIPQQEDQGETLIRIFDYDIPGNKNIYVGLTYIKGISWTIANAICLQMGLDRTVRISTLSKDQIKQIEAKILALHNDLPVFMRNRRKDFDTGEDKHLLKNDLDIQKEFDIKRLKKMKSYRGIRHSLGQPVRGQRTRSHFRKREGRATVKRKKE